MRVRSKYSLMLIMGTAGPWKLTRNLRIYGRVTKYPKAIPARKRKTVENMKPVMAPRSCLYRAGATKSHIW